MEELITSIIALLPASYTGWIALAVALAATAAPWLPKAEDGTGWAIIRKVIDILGQNFRNAANVK